MTDPFIIHDRDVDEHALGNRPSRRWVEDTAPEHADGLDYLTPSLKSSRFKIGYVALAVLFLVLIVRGVQLQILKGGEYRSAAETNRIRIVRLPAPRGTITDRTGVPLTHNVPRFELTINPLDVPRDPVQKNEMITRLAGVVQMPADELQSALTIVRLPVSPVVLATNLTLDEVYPLLVQTQAIAGVSVDIVSAREYVYPEDFAHIIGYLGKLSDTEKEKYLSQGYYLNDTIGKAGLEASFEEYLRGKDGQTFVEINAQGKPQTTIASQDAVPGKTLTLTIDATLQEKVSDILKTHLAAMKKTRGVVVALNPQNGEILALSSMPSYDPNLFSHEKERVAAYRALLENPDHPLFARATAGTYPSGSIVKPAIAAAALQERVITPTTSVLSVGGIHVGQWFFPDWKAGGHGVTNVIKAIAESVNTFFYTIGGGYGNLSGLGIDRLDQYLSRFGFGSPTEIEIPGEAKGLVPTPAWKAARSPEPWYIGDTYHLSIGQGDFLVTPIQIARMIAYFASSGKWTRPHVVMNDEKGDMKQDDIGPNIDPDHIQTVREGMRATILAGSARSLQALPVTMAGKTGTAQWSSTKPTHAWFAGFAPYENPEIAIVVLVEEGGEGSTAAVPIAREIVQWWYEHIHKSTP